MTLTQNLADQLKARARSGGMGHASEQDGEQNSRRIRRANEAAWKDMVTASQKELVELQRGWAEALSRFH